MYEQEAVVATAGHVGLRLPQKQALDILIPVTELLPLRRIAKGVPSDLRDALATVQKHYPTVADFERDFPCLCFALATGVGKTRLMGAFITQLYLADRFTNFLVVAPNVTIYEKLISDFTPTSPKYVLRGVSDFVVSPPRLVTGENFEQEIGGGRGRSTPTIYIFTIAKLMADMRGGKSSKMGRFREEIGESAFDYLSGLDDLVLLMDEAHCYRATESKRTLDALRPILGLEFTATSFVTKSRGRRPFKNVIYDYPLARAMIDALVKEPAVVTRENFNAATVTAQELERLKLDDAILQHEFTKRELETYARQTGWELIKPIALIIARDTAHAAWLKQLLTSKAFCEGRYAGKVIQVDSSTREEETVRRLLEVERTDEPTEIVIHVNMLGIGWDVRNLYTIVLLRPGHSWTLVVQTAGRGLRLPYGRRTGVPAIDRLSIIAHDRFQEFVDEARRPGSPFLLREVVLSDEGLTPRPATIVCEPDLLVCLGLGKGQAADNFPARFSEAERPYLGLIWRGIGELEFEFDKVSCLQQLKDPDIRSVLRDKVRCSRGVEGLSLPDLESLIEKVVGEVIELSIGIPRIVTTARQSAFSYRRFELNMDRLPRALPSEALWAEHLRTGSVDRISAPAMLHAGKASAEDYLVDLLADLDSIAYDRHGDLLRHLAVQYKRHILLRMSEADLLRLLSLRGGEVARGIQAQMHEHLIEPAASGARLEITRGFTTLRPYSFSAVAGEMPIDFRVPPPAKANIARSFFGGFSRCLYRLQKFDSDAERRLAVILDRDANKWMRPTWAQLQLVYRLGTDEREYVPDFIAEIDAKMLIVEVKALRSMQDVDVLAKRDAAMAWCDFASAHATPHGGKPRHYVLIPHDAVVENMTLEGLVCAHGQTSQGNRSVHILTASASGTKS